MRHLALSGDIGVAVCPSTTCRHTHPHTVTPPPTTHPVNSFAWIPTGDLPLFTRPPTCTLVYPLSSVAALAANSFSRGITSSMPMLGRQGGGEGDGRSSQEAYCVYDCVCVGGGEG